MDQGSAFTSVVWTHRVDAVGTVVQTSDVESHNSFGSVRRYHAPLRRVFNEIVPEDPKIDGKMALQLAVKAMNDTMGPDGLVPSYLVFGCIPHFPAVDSIVPNQKDRMNALEKAHNEMATIVAELRPKTALSFRFPRNADLSVAAEGLVCVFREAEKRMLDLSQ